MCHRQPGGTKEKAKMKTYLIDGENSITALGIQQADFEGEIFGSQEQLTDLAAKWPANRLVDVWNGIPGLTPVKKFKDQKSAVARIWKAIQSLDGGSPAETPPQPGHSDPQTGNRGQAQQVCQ